MNAVGAIATAGVLVVFVMTKLREGAWVVMVTIPLGVWLFLTIARHYEEADRELSLDGHAPTADRPDVMMVIVAAMNRGTVEAVRYAVNRCRDVRAVHVDLDAGCAADIRRDWAYSLLTVIVHDSCV